MQFFIALSVIVIGACTYLLHQFWSGSLSIDDEAQASVAPDAADGQSQTLKAA